MVLKGKTGASFWPRYMSLSCHESCKRSLILKLWSLRSHGEILKFSGYTLSDLDLTFDLAVVTLTYKILSGLYLGNHKMLEVDTW